MYNLQEEELQDLYLEKVVLDLVEEWMEIKEDLIKDPIRKRKEIMLKIRTKSINYR